MSETILGLAEVRSRLHELHKRYKITDNEFRGNPEARSRVSCEDEFEWEAFLTHQEVLRECEERVHREYLSHGVTVSQRRADRDTVREQLAA
jgi:hypothetical protein